MRRRRPLKQGDGHGFTVEEKNGPSRRRCIDNTREDMNNYYLKTDMTDNGQYWKMMVKTGPKDMEMVSKSEKVEKSCCRMTTFRDTTKSLMNCCKAHYD